MNQNTGDVLVAADEFDLEVKGEEMKRMCMSCEHKAGQIHSKKTSNTSTEKGAKFRCLKTTKQI